MSAEYLAKYGADVLANGYLIIPIVKGSKAPGLGHPAKKWSAMRADSAKLNEWIDKGFGSNGLGIISSRTPGVDIDCQDPALVEHLREFTINLLGETIERVGLAPKTLLVYRAEGQFPKVNSNTYIDSQGRNAKLEILGDGQQFVALAVHPDTKKPYRWKNKKGVHNTAVSSLPTINAVQADLIRDEFERLVRERGWSKKTNAIKRLSSGGAIDHNDPFIHDAPKVNDLTDAEIRTKLLTVPNADDYEIWLQMGMALYHQYDGSEDGLALWHEWSQDAANYDSKALDSKWGSFDVEGKRRPPTTARIILKLAHAEETRVSGEALEKCRDSIKMATNLPELVEAAKMAKGVAFDRPTREMLAGIVKAVYKALTGTAPSISLARDMVRYESPDNAGVIPFWLDGYVYVQLDETFYNWKSRLSLSTKGFDATYGRFLLTRSDQLEGKSSPEHLPSQLALHLYRIPTVANKMYMPGEDEIFSIDDTSYVNSYSDKSVPEIPEIISQSGRKAVERMVAHTAHLFSNTRDRELLLDWIAFIVQTQQRISWAPIIQGVSSDGKSYFYGVMKVILGNDNCISIKGKALEEDYNGWAEGNLLVFIEEVRLHGKNRFDAINNLKTNITNGTVEIRRMRTDRYEVINRSSYLITTNHRDGMPMDPSDTRYFPLFSRWQSALPLATFKKDNPDYYPDLYATLNEPGALRKYFMERTLGEEFSAVARAPVSSYRNEMIEMTRSEEVEAFERSLEDDVAHEYCDAILNSALCAAKMTGHGASAPLGTALKRMLAEAGYSYLGRFWIGGEHKRLWSARPHLFQDEEGKLVKELVEAYFDEAPALDLTGL